MLTIRKEQLEILSKVVEISFKESTVEFIKEKYPSETNERSDIELMEFIEKGILKAEKHNIIERADISTFIEYMILYGDDFDANSEYSWARKVFRIVNLTGKEKIQRLLTKQPL